MLREIVESKARYKVEVSTGKDAKFVVYSESTSSKNRSRYKGGFKTEAGAMNYGYKMGYEFILSGEVLSNPKVMKSKRWTFPKLYKTLQDAGLDFDTKMLPEDFAELAFRTEKELAQAIKIIYG